MDTSAQIQNRHLLAIQYHVLNYLVGINNQPTATLLSALCQPNKMKYSPHFQSNSRTTSNKTTIRNSSCTVKYDNNNDNGKGNGNDNDNTPSASVVCSRQATRYNHKMLVFAFILLSLCNYCTKYKHYTVLLNLSSASIAAQQIIIPINEVRVVARTLTAPTIPKTVLVFPLPPSKWLADIDTNATSTSCGKHKCHFESRTNIVQRRRRDNDNDTSNSNDNINNSNDNDSSISTSTLTRRRRPKKHYGYLVTQTKSSNTTGKIDDDWKLAQLLSKKFLIRHLLTEARPTQMHITEELANRINDNIVHISTVVVSSKSRPAPFVGGSSSTVTSISNGNGNETETTTLQQQKQQRPFIIVQPIELAPHSCILFGDHPNKYQVARTKLKELFASDKNDDKHDPNQNQNQTTEMSSSSLSAAATLASWEELQKFEERLLFDLNATQHMLHSTEGSCLRKDFQVLIDPITGSIYHLDFDRCFEEKSSKRNSFHHLLSYAEELLQLRRQQHRQSYLSLSSSSSSSMAATTTSLTDLFLGSVPPLRKKHSVENQWKRKRRRRESYKQRKRDNHKNEKEKMKHQLT